MSILLTEIPTETILKISPYNAYGYGLALAVLIWVVFYFKAKIAEKEKVISELINKNHKAWDVVADKLSELKTLKSLEAVDRNTIIQDLTSIKNALEI